jgi:hypothetical protein
MNAAKMTEGERLMREARDRLAAIKKADGPAKAARSFLPILDRLIVHMEKDRTA